ncbi:MULTISPECIES: TonB-dependent receptor plug domain-containing protein [Qipengyuania]|uniref:TonB-dependent receptor n=1 Tax=Qipengyuania soli TaxID=2782568 RepID=A0A7S8F4A1_9SPHN|nr:TonB-dependent receptor [Qipengyuania soli]QPC98889.1 TonB-dependent receptor [Qipengyuania soli]
MNFRGKQPSARALLVAATAVWALASADVAMAQDAGSDDTAAAEEDSDAPAIVVIGTRRTDRSAVNSASPVDVISASEIQSQPAANMLDVVKNVVPSFFVPQNTISDASTFVRAPSLRGLPADNILVMLNGKRFNRSALVQVYTGGDTALSFGSQGADISSIPAIAVGNLQVLRDGATAQYGSDAIGGVLNYGLRDDTGFEAQALYGQHYEGDGETWQISGYGGIGLGDNGFISVAGEYYDSEGTSRGVQRPSAVNFANQFPNLADQLPNYPGPVQIWGSSPSHGWKVVVNSEFEVSPQATFYLFGNFANSKADQSFNYREAVTTTATRFNGTSSSTGTLSANSAFRHPIYLTACPAGNATCPSGGFVRDANVFNFTELYPAGFTPRFVGETDQAIGVAGIKGSLDSGFTYDLSGSLARQSLNLSMYNSLAPSYGPATQTEFQFGKLIQRELNLNLDMTYPLDMGLASPVTLSWGAEFRREEYEATEGDPQSYGAGPYAVQDLYVQTSPGVYAYDSTVTMPPAASGYGGTSPTFAGTSSEKSWGVYVGAEADLTDRLSMGIAGRYEDYENFGSATVGKINALLEVTDAVSLRATAGTGFHAPSPGQNNVQVLTTTFIQGNQVQVGTYPVTSDIAQFYGATTLGPEESTNFGAGIVIKPSNNFTLTADGYSIKVRDRIGISQTFTVSAADIVALPSLAGVGEGGSVQYFTNGFDTLTRGIDVVGTYRTGLGDGSLNLTLAYNYNKSKVTNFDPGVIGPTQLIDIKYLAPNHRATFSANWEIGDFAINFRESYYGEWRDSNDYPIREGNLSTGAIIDGQHFGAKFITDLDVSYTFADKYTLTVGANNLFDTYPDKIAATVNNPIYDLTGSISNGSIYPRPGGPFGLNGGYWYARIRVKY